MATRVALTTIARRQYLRLQDVPHELVRRTFRDYSRLLPPKPSTDLQDLARTPVATVLLRIARSVARRLPLNNVSNPAPEAARLDQKFVDTVVIIDAYAFQFKWITWPLCVGIESCV